MKKGVVIFNDNVDYILAVGDKEEMLKFADSSEMTRDDIEKLEEIDQYVPDSIILFNNDLRFMNIPEIIERHPTSIKSILSLWTYNIACECILNSKYRKFILDELKKASKNDITIKNI